MKRKKELLSGIKCVVFDIDGTLMDSIPRIVECIGLSCKKHNIEAPSQQACFNVIGLGLNLAIQQVIPNESKDTQALVAETYRLTYTELEDAKPTELFPGALDMIKKLKENGIKIAIATGKSMKGWNRVAKYAHLGEYVDYVVTADTALSKPNNQMLRKISDSLKLPIKSCIMVGDSTLDIQMAINAKMPNIAITTGVHTKEQLYNSNADFVVDDLSSILDLLNLK